MKENIYSFYKRNSVIHILSPIVSIVGLGIVIFSFLSFYNLLADYKTVFLYTIFFIANSIIHTFQLIIGLHLSGKLKFKKKYITMLSHICIGGSLIQTMVITTYTVNVFCYRFSEFRPISVFAFIPLICALSIITTGLSGYCAADIKFKGFNIILIYMFIIYASAISVLAFMPLNSDIVNKFAYPLKLRSEMRILDDISYSGGEIHYINYYIYIISGLICILILGFRRKGFKRNAL